MKNLISLLTLVFLSFSLMAQVGVNTPAPDLNSVLDLTSKTKGVLVPRMTTVQREAMSDVKFSQGMMVYDITLDILFVGYGNGASSTKWYAMNPWKTEYRTYNNASSADMTTMTDVKAKHGKVGIGVPVPTEKLHVAGKVKATEFIGNGTTPLGGIIMWSGSTAPTGWALCTGGTVNGYKTPNLKGRFVVGYDNGRTNYDNPGNLSTKGTGPSDAGGDEYVTLTKSQMPSHNHSGTTSGVGHHTHGYYTPHKGGNVLASSKAGNWLWRHGNKLYNTGGAGAHSHTFSTSYNGSGHSHENRPPYYTLAYIMRVY